MSFVPLDDRQVIQRAALSAIGSVANNTLDGVFASLNSILGAGSAGQALLSNGTSPPTYSNTFPNAMTFSAAGTALLVDNNAQIDGSISALGGATLGSNSFTGFNLILDSATGHSTNISWQNNSSTLWTTYVPGGTTNFDIINASSTNILTITQAGVATFSNELITSFLGVGAGTGINTAALITMQSPAFAGSAGTGIGTWCVPTLTSAIDDVYTGFFSGPTLAASGNIPRLLDFYAFDNGTTGQTVTNRVAFYCSPQTTAINSAVLSDNTGFVGKWFVNQSNTNPNLFGAYASTFGTTANPGSAQTVVTIQGSTTPNTNQAGLVINAGTSASDYALVVSNAPRNTNLLILTGAGVLTLPELAGVGTRSVAADSSGNLVLGGSSGAPVGALQSAFLNETQYQAQQGTGWILADGRNVAGSAYATITGNSTVPDCRGLVLRASNNGGSAAGTRADGNQDPAGVLATGTYEGDTTAVNGLHDTGHQHNTTSGNLNLMYFVGTGGVGDTETGVKFQADGGKVTGVASAALAGDTETRVKAIIVNHFIRIN